MNDSQNTSEQINLFKSIFKGREDVFAVRWEKGKKSGYMPAYSYDPYMYRLHKMNGGTFSNYTDKSYRPFTNEQLLKHLAGEQFIGIYPLLQNNTSWFIVADFDKNKWQEECKSFISICKQHRITAYFERSRSGNGGHVWIFFEQAYPAIKSRILFKSLLEQCGAFYVFDKASSFDRLFPNQDFLSGKGLGNLIALPLFKNTLKQENSCFIDTETLIPFDNQWDFLKQIERISSADLDKLYHSIHKDEEVKSYPVNTSSKLIISLNNSVRINRLGLTLPLINFLKTEFNLPNSEYFIKKKTKRSTWNTKRYFNLIEETKNEIILPSGAIGKVLRFCTTQKIDFEFDDQRKKAKSIPFVKDLNLLKHQHIAIEASGKKDFGVIVAPPGSGKTIMALKIIAEKQQPALIIVHRKQLLEQWVERIESFLKIRENEIGKIGSSYAKASENRQGKSKVGKHITVAMIQSLRKKIADEKLTDAFKTVIIDECHHIPAESYSSTISKLHPYYQYGLTATPFRKYDDGKLIFAYLGEVIAEIKPQDIETYKRARIVIRNTNFNIPFNSKTDQFETLSKVLIHDSARNKLIIDDISAEINKGKKAVVITERKEHIEALNQFLKQSYEVITLSGEDSESSRALKWKALNEGNYQVLITTGQFFGEGTDLQNANCLFLVYPFSFKGKLIQYIGRVQRSEVTPVIYDYRDHKIDYLNRLFLKRNTYYRNFDKQATLFNDPEELVVNPANNSFTIYKKIKVNIEKLDFCFGSVAFNYSEKRLQNKLEFEIEHDYIRPEFDVLKPLFAKTIGSKTVEINVFAEFQNNIIVSQLAASTDLEKINREIIESVRFKFVEQTYFGNKFEGKTISDLDAEQHNQTSSSLYQSNEELLEDVLKNKSVKHFRQLRHLADNHSSSILKLRFVLSPFAFVFLLSGKQQYHIVLETLDTEEATYIWHIEKSISSLKSKLKLIDEDLNTIKNNGRQKYLESQPEKFSRIIHDYSDKQKGFVQWRDSLEERLY